VTAIILALILVIIAAVIVIPSPRQHRQQTRTTGDRRLRLWATDVRRQLPAAFQAQNITKSGFVVRGQRPTPTIVGAGKPIVMGWQWDLVLPGSTIDEDWEGERIAAAINDTRRLAAVAEVVSPYPGHATLSVWRKDPLTLPSTITYKPGQLPVDKWGDRWSLGRDRDGHEIRLPLWLPGGGAYHHLFSGATGSGKTRWMLLLLAHAMQLGAEIYVVDPKGLDDRDWIPVLDGITDGWDSMPKAIKALERLHADTMRRPRWEPSDPGRFRVIVIDEVQELLKQGGEEIFVKLVSEMRSKGAMVAAATQLPEVKVIDSVARTNMRVKMAGRLDNEAEYKAALGQRWKGEKIPDSKAFWGTGYIDLDGRGARRFRGWNVSDGWLAAHTRTQLEHPQWTASQRTSSGSRSTTVPT
jgi:hypothetical protein